MFGCDDDGARAWFEDPDEGGEQARVKFVDLFVCEDAHAPGDVLMELVEKKKVSCGCQKGGECARAVCTGGQ